jgi:hypothetical protein
MANTETLNQIPNADAAKTNKLTVGFTVFPLDKLKISQAAQEVSLSVSEFCEMTILSALDKKNLIDEEKEKLIEKVAFYEHKILQDILQSHKGETIKFLNAQGAPLEITISSIEDVFTILINSFKSSKP